MDNDQCTLKLIRFLLYLSASLTFDTELSSNLETEVYLQHITPKTNMVIVKCLIVIQKKKKSNICLMSSKLRQPCFLSIHIHNLHSFAYHLSFYIIITTLLAWLCEEQILDHDQSLYIHLCDYGYHCILFHNLGMITSV